MKKSFALAFAVCAMFFGGSAFAQVGHGGEPLFNHSAAKVKTETVYLSVVDNEKYIAEDMDHKRGAGPMRVGIQRNCDIDVLSSSTVVKDGSGVHYLLAISSPGAVFQNICFDRFEMVDGATLYIYDRSGELVLGSFEKSDVLDGGDFLTQAIPGDMAYLEYNVPEGSESGSLHIDQICHGYKNIFGTIASIYDDAEASLKGPHGSAEGNCHINVVCPEGDDWRDQIRAVVAIQISTSNAAYMCSGTLLNNTRQDFTPYVLSAYHCQDESSIGTIRNFVTYFNYETSTCNGTTGNTTRSLSGAERVAKYSYSSGSDFLLLRLNRQVPDAYKPYYAGWDRQSISTPTNGACIHHPGGDYKKISIPRSVSVAPSSYNKFYMTYWYSGSQNKGVTEEGSSGSALFNAEKRVIGQLYAGSSSCENMSGYDMYGRFSVSWNGNNTSTGRLSSWLDPDGTGVTTLDGLDYQDVAIDIADGSQSKSLNVYPNPSDGRLHFDIDALGEANYKVFDQSGRCVKEGRTVLTAMVQALDLSALPRGAYVLQLFASSQRFSANIVISK